MQNEKNRRDLAAGIVLAILDAGYLHFCGEVRPFTGKGATPLTNQFMPYFWGTVLMILSIVLIIRAVIREKTAGTGSGTKQGRGISLRESILENREVILSFAALFFYILLMKNIGFLIMTAIFVPVEILILTQKEKRNYPAAIAAGVITAVLLSFIFGRVLHILLPAGILHL